MCARRPFRVPRPASLNAVVDALLALARLGRDLGDRIDAVDVNPFVVLEPGRGGRALDALIVTRQA